MSNLTNEIAGNANVNKPTVMALFSGCGGLDLGFHMAGYEIVYANDIDKAVKETYEKNIGKIDILDICEVDKSKLPDADVVLAGIPCQPFSSAGKRKGVNDIRGNLFNEVIDILSVKRPKIVLFENVRGFLSAVDNDGRKMPDRIKIELNSVGYNLYYKLLNSSDFNVPQNRFRVVLIGVRSDIDKGFRFPKPNKNKLSLVIGNVIGKPLPKDEKEEVWALSPQALKIIEYIPEGGSWKNIPDYALPERLKKIREEIKKYRSPNFYRRFSRSEIMGTVTAAATPENSGILHPIENRRYSVREIARFQSFPDSFKFVGATISQKYKMIGNAVPVNMSKEIAISIMQQYFSCEG